MTRRFCDLCGIEIPIGKLLFGVAVRLIEGALTDDEGIGELDACASCVDQVHALFARLKAESELRH